LSWPKEFWRNALLSSSCRFLVAAAAANQIIFAASATQEVGLPLACLSVLGLTNGTLVLVQICTFLYIVLSQSVYQR
jgi:hypothetical protein